MTDSRSSSALFKRAEQLKRWAESDTNKQSTQPKHASRIHFSTEIEFLAACTAGDKDEVQRLLKLGADINTANVDGLTALHQACIDNNLEMVEFLVENGADVNRGDNEGWTALHATASCGFLSMARYLLENGADVGAVNYNGDLAIDIAQTDAVESLLQEAIKEQGVDCAKSRNAEVNMLLADAQWWAVNGYVEDRDPKTGSTPLHVAAAKGYLEVVRTLLEDCGVEPSSVDNEGWTPLHAAALWAQRGACELLLAFGADPHRANLMGQTCFDLADPSISGWLAEAALTTARRVSRRRPRPPAEPQRADQEIINEPPPAAERPPRARAPSPEGAPADDDAPSWRRSASFRAQRPDHARENKPANTGNTLLQRATSYEGDKRLYERYCAVTERFRANSLPALPAASPSPSPSPAPQNSRGPEPIETAVRSQADRTDREASSPVPNTIITVTAASPTSPTSPGSLTSPSSVTTPTVRSGEAAGGDSGSVSGNSTPSAATPTKLSPGNIFKNFFKSIVPPVRDEESETQRKAHAKRVRETRRSTQGVTLDEIKSAEQLVKKKTAAVESPKITAETSPATPASKKPDDGAKNNDNSAGAGAARGPGAGAAGSERRPSWRLRLDPASKFELEDASRAAPAAPAAASAAPAAPADTTVTIALRRPPLSPSAACCSSANIYTSTPIKDDRTGGGDGAEERGEGDGRLPFSSQTALNVIQRRRRPKRRSTGVGHVDMDDIINERGGNAKADADAESPSGSERSDRSERGSRTEEPADYKALYEASSAEVRRLRGLLSTSEQQLREARASITRLTQVNQSSLSEIEKREKRAMERKLSEMEEELKQLQKLKAENETLRAENRALTRAVNNMSNNAAK